MNRNTTVENTVRIAPVTLREGTFFSREKKVPSLIKKYINFQKNPLSGYKPSSVTSHLARGHLSRTYVTICLYLPPRLMGALRFSRCLFCGISPNRVYTDRLCYHRPGRLLPHLFTITEINFGCYFLLHCPGSCLRRTLSVILAHGSSDFPQKRPFGTAPAIARPAKDYFCKSFILSKPF